MLYWLKMSKTYLILTKDTPILSFTYDNVNLDVLEYFNEYEFYKYSLKTWIESRKVLCKHILTSDVLYVAANDFEYLVQISHCVSMNDTLWVKDINDSLTWNDIKPYGNLTVFYAGLNLQLQQIPERPLPELSTSGSFPKCWVTLDSKDFLLKRGLCDQSGVLQSNYPLFAEVLACQLAEYLGLPHISYALDDSLTDYLVTKCKCFTNEEIGFIPYTQAATYNFPELNTFDYLIMNIDRHSGNFGMLINTKNGKIVKEAPIYDNNLSLLASVYSDDCDIRYQYNYIMNTTPMKKLFEKADRKYCEKIKDFRFSNPGFGCSEKYVYALNYCLHENVNRLIGGLHA